MVSTRSQSVLSDSNADKNATLSLGLPEVTSKRTKKPRASQKQQKKKEQTELPQLEIINEEEEVVINNGEKIRNKRISGSVIDKLAEEIFAVLREQAAPSVPQSKFPQSEQTVGAALETTAAALLMNNGATEKEGLQWRPSLRLPMEQPASQQQRAASTVNDLIEGRSGGFAGQLVVPPADERKAARLARKSAPSTAGKSWFDLPAGTITDEVKTDLRMLQLRSAFDPKKFYRKLDSTKFPKHFQFGTVVEGPTDFYAARLSRNERKQTLTEEIASDVHLTDIRKRRYNKMQEENAKFAGRRGRRTNNERLKKKPRRPKH
jgi:hypothetical protein